MIKLRMPDNYIGLSRGYSSSHLGVDFGWNSNYGGQNVQLYAPADGTVTAVVDGYGNTYPSNRIYGNYLTIDHGNGIVTLLAHLLKGSFRVKKGDKVKMGQAIAKMNNSGYSNGSHLHFEVRINGNKVNPLLYTYVYPDQVVSPNTACKGEIKRYDPTPTAKIGKLVDRDTGRLQLKINIDSLWGRKRPETSEDVKLGFMNPGIYNILDTRDMTQEQSNGYLWYRVEESVWCAKGEWLEVLEPEAPEPIPENPAEDKADWQLVYETAAKYI